MESTNLTENEKAYIKAILDSDYAEELDSWVWSFSPVDRLPEPRKQWSGVASSLTKKGLAEVSGHSGDDAAIRLTSKGIEAARDLYPDHCLLRG